MRQPVLLWVLFALTFPSSRPLTHALVSSPSRVGQTVPSHTPQDSRSRSNDSGSRSYVEWIDPETNCQVILLGCLHGSLSSAADVRELLLLSSSDMVSTTDVVVLELCATRFADLQQRTLTLAAAAAGDGSHRRRRPNVISRFWNMVQTTSAQRGWTTGVAAAVLGGASGIQTALSGFEPGLEFTTALESARRTECHVILADQTVDETLRRLGSLPSVAWDMIHTNNSFQNTSKALQTAVFGDSTMESHHQVHMGKVLTRNPAVLQDLIRLTLPPLLVAQLVVSIGHAVWNVLEGGQDVATTSSMYMWMATLFSGDMALSTNDIGRMATDLAIDASTSALVFLTGYVALALPTARVILCERDEPLAEGIRAACRLATSKKKTGRVVAVLGLLHVNGVAQRLLRGSTRNDEPQL